MLPSISTSRAGPPQVSRSRSEEADLCREWYEAYARPIYSYIRFHVNSADIADDLTAETFLKAIRSLGHFNPAKGSARVWVFRIAKNNLRDHLRRTRIRRHLPLSHLRDLATDSPSPEERLLWQEQVTGLLDALTRLNRRHRDLVSLRYGSGLDGRAIADILGMSEAAVRKGLSRALHRLRNALEDER